MRLVRTIEIISYFSTGPERSYVYTITKEFYDFKLEMIRKYITEDEVKALVNTGNWHTITADLEGAPEATKKMAVHVVEYGALFVPVDRYKDSTVNTGDDEYTRLFGRKE